MTVEQITDELTLTDRLLLEQRRAKVTAIRNNTIAAARSRLEERDLDGALEALVEGAHYIARIERSA